jgi:hypothetical protein
MPAAVVDRRCLWCEQEVGFDAEDKVWFHSDTGKVLCADGEHNADPLELRPLTGGRLVWIIAGGVILAVVLISIVIALATPSACEREIASIEAELEDLAAEQPAGIIGLSQQLQELERLSERLEVVEANC